MFQPITDTIHSMNASTTQPAPHSIGSLEIQNLILADLQVIKCKLDTLVNRETRKEWYTTEEFANLVGKAEYTIREYCRHGRLKATKQRSGRGSHLSWVISHTELERFQRDGLLPIQRPN